MSTTSEPTGARRASVCETNICPPLDNFSNCGILGGPAAKTGLSGATVACRVRQARNDRVQSTGDSQSQKGEFEMGVPKPHTGANEGAKPEIIISVNEHQVTVVGEQQTGRSIKSAACEAGVEIDLDFVVLVEGSPEDTKVIRDDESVSVTTDTRVRAIRNDDNS